MGDFKHITVTPAADEDVVIMAGIGSDESAGEALPNPSAADEQGNVSATHVPDSPSTNENDAKNEPQKRSSAHRPAKDEYREQTLEDLDSAPMPTAQKIVIIAAIVCIIGALVYCIAFMR